MTIVIQPCSITHIPLVTAHYERLREQSGLEDVHFMPFVPGSQEGPRGPDHLKLHLALHRSGWERCFIAIDRDHPEQVVGHVDLKGGRLATEMHRCTLGIGIEAEYCNQGLGKRLMQTAIDFARAMPELSCIDLGVFSSNQRARALYTKMGFVELGTVPDRFRIGRVVIDDVMMYLKL